MVRTNPKNVKINMNTKMTSLLSVAAILAGCSTASGPTFNAYSVGLPNGPQTFEVACHGLLEGPSTCFSKAREICSDQPVRATEDLAPLGSTNAGERDIRKLRFQCGAAPVAQQPTRVMPAPPPPAPRPLPPPPQKLTLSGDANFDTDRSTFTPQARARLDKLIADARGITFDTVMTSGQTDSVGPDAYNQSLSTRRAEEVAGYLKAHGLVANKFVAWGRGKTEPVASNLTPSGRAQNRRVEIVLNQN
jgi:OOP family OmpA-OmpF porin